MSGHQKTSHASRSYALSHDQDIENGYRGYLRGRFPSQYKQSTFSSALCNQVGNFSHLKRLVSGAEVAIEQLCDFFSRAWLFDLV